MKLENFKIHNDKVSIEINGRYFDLHNQYDFQSVSYDVIKKNVQLSWVKRSCDWIPNDFPDSITILFDRVSLVKYKERDSEMPFTEDGCTQNIAFIDDPENELFCSNEPRTNRACLFVNFMSGASIIIQSDTCTYVVSPV